LRERSIADALGGCASGLCVTHPLADLRRWRRKPDLSGQMSAGTCP
jgi:hypothetical protein